jgi:lysophospholipase L1-like esterase
MLLIGFGDSITAGIYLRQDQTYLHLLGAKLRMEVRNAGVPGQTTRDGLARMEQDVLHHRPAVCVIAFGLNDHCAIESGIAKIGLNEYKSNLKAMVAACQSIGCDAILCTIHPVLLGDENQFYYARHPKHWYINPEGAEHWLRLYNGAIREVASETGALLADIELFWLNALKRGCELHRLLRKTDNCGQYDGVHPTEAGQKLYMRCISRSLRHLQSPNRLYRRL